MDASKYTIQWQSEGAPAFLVANHKAPARKNGRKMAVLFVKMATPSCGSRNHEAPDRGVIERAVQRHKADRDEECEKRFIVDVVTEQEEQRMERKRDGKQDDSQRGTSAANTHASARAVPTSKAMCAILIGHNESPKASRHTDRKAG